LFEFEQMNERIKKLAVAPLFIDDTPALSIFELRAKARRLKENQKVELIIIDYLQLMSGGPDGKGNREQEISHISRGLKSLAKEFNALYLFETNVGAGLPVIGTLNDLRRSGDKVSKIQAVLSGTLNFVFNNYNGSKPFTEVVKQAQDEGYTEPDPRLDLGGTDVMRKIMILAREAGEKIEMEDITNNAFLPVSCFDGSVEDFYKEMGKQEAHFKALYDEAAAKNCKLKFVAQYENGKASVGLQHIPADSDFYHLYGKDNIVLFYTQRYPEQPLVVKGAGAGADVTASGVFADIIRVARV